MYTLNCRGLILSTETPQVMGIINVTPDSFFDGSRSGGDADILQRAGKMLEEGASIIDIGGQSTRPGAEEVGEAEELRRVIGPVSALHQAYPRAVISVDTWYAGVAREAVAAGASMVNDISGGCLDPAMLATVGALGVPYICMHMKGRPSTMHKLAIYDDLTLEVMDFFIERLEACRQAGIRDVVLDPGLGFAKNRDHNLRLLKELSVLHTLDRPLLIGLSRKSVIYKTLGITAGEALNGTTALNTLALLNGAAILRVHDVKEAREAITLVEAYKKIPGR